MKYIVIPSLLFGLILSGTVAAQSDNQDTNHANSSGMDMSGMDMKRTSSTAAVYEAVGVVRAVNRSTGRVTIAHQPIASLGWPAMTMGFSVKDKRLFDQLLPGKTVQFGFIEQGNKYVITGVH